jgi:hypothetical protein
VSTPLFRSDAERMCLDMPSGSAHSAQFLRQREPKSLSQPRAERDPLSPSRASKQALRRRVREPCHENRAATVDRHEHLTQVSAWLKDGTSIDADERTRFHCSGCGRRRADASASNTSVPASVRCWRQSSRPRCPCPHAHRRWEVSMLSTPRALPA